MAASEEFVIWFESLRRKDGEKVGGKNSSLGEMVQTLKGHGINVPDGFATTAHAYWRFVDANDLRDLIAEKIGAWEDGDASLAETGKAIREAFLKSTWPKDLAEAIRASYRELSGKYDMDHADVAVRSSATAEDLPDASFAGQQESFLNIAGEKALLDACRRCYASLFTDRAISYRKAKGFDHFKVALSIGVQKMVRADIGASGVMFSIDTETGFDRAVLINAAWGLGENVVQGAVDPDEYTVFKPLLDNDNLMPILEKKNGSKKIKMIYAKSGDS
ncbi:MAG: PEP/pyruvate-binding domain-containing protein, partial [Salinarimonas sp.]